jgi:hypothetical protein
MKTKITIISPMTISLHVLDIMGAFCHSDLKNRTIIKTEPITGFSNLFPIDALCRDPPLGHVRIKLPNQ